MQRTLRSMKFSIVQFLTVVALSVVVFGCHATAVRDVSSNQLASVPQSAADMYPNASRRTLDENAPCDQTRPPCQPTPICQTTAGSPNFADVNYVVEQFAGEYAPKEAANIQCLGSGRDSCCNTLRTFQTAKLSICSCGRGFGTNCKNLIPYFRQIRDACAGVLTVSGEWNIGVDITGDQKTVSYWVAITQAIV